MLRLIHIALLIPLLTIALAALPSCSGKHAPAPVAGEQPGAGIQQAPDSIGTFLPSPASLLPLLDEGKSASYAEEDYIHHGKDYSTVLPSQHVGGSSGSAKFSTTWSDATNKAAADLGFCFFDFQNLQAYSRDTEVRYGWIELADDVGTAWIAIANWDRNRWDWHQCTGSGLASLPSFGPYISSTNHLVAAVVVANEGISRLRWIRLGPIMVDAQLSVSPKQSLSPSDVNASAFASTTAVGTLDLFEWNWDNDDSFEEDTGAAATAQHTYSDLGWHTIQVRASNTYGESDIDATMVGVIEPWVHSMGGTAGDHIEAVAYDGEDHIYAAGYTTSYGSGGADVLLLKYTTSGELLWAKAWGGTASEAAYAMCLAGDQIYLAGLTSSFGEAGNDIFVQSWWIATGQPVNTSTWGGAGYDHATSIASRGDYLYVAGVTDSWGAGVLDGVLIKYNLSCGLQWAKTWGGTETDMFNAVTTSYNVMTQTTQIHLTGYTDSVSSAREVLYLRFLTDGSLSTQRTWEADFDSQSQEGMGIASYGFFGDVFIGGTIEHGTKNSLLLLRSGSSPFAKRWGSSSSDQVVTGLLRQGDSIVLSGYSNGFGSGNAALLASFSLTGDLLASPIWHASDDDDRFYAICGFANNGLLVGGYGARAEGGSWSQASTGLVSPIGTWTDQVIALESHPLYTNPAFGTTTDITDAVIDSGGGGSDALISLHHIPTL
jgi:hypothetical protein